MTEHTCSLNIWMIFLQFFFLIFFYDFNPVRFPLLFSRTLQGLLLYRVFSLSSFFSVESFYFCSSYFKWSLTWWSFCYIPNFSSSAIFLEDFHQLSVFSQVLVPACFWASSLICPYTVCCFWCLGLLSKNTNVWQTKSLTKPPQKS